MYNNLTGCRSVNLGATTDPQTYFFGFRFDRFRYSDPTIHIGYSITGSMPAAEQLQIDNGMVDWDTGSMSRVDTFPEAWATSEADFERLPGNIPGFGSNVNAALTRVDFFNCPSYIQGATADLPDAAWIGCRVLATYIDVASSFGSRPTDAQREIATHELGHAVSLAHWPGGQPTIMVPGNGVVGSGLKNLDRNDLSDLYRF